MSFFNTRNTKYDKLVIRLTSLVKSKDDVPQCAWKMLTDLGEECVNYSELTVAMSLRDSVYSRIMEQANRPIPDFVPSKRKLEQ